MAKNHTKKVIDLNFAGYQYLPSIKANRKWQQKLLNSKLVYMVKTISLDATIFRNPNFLSYTKHTLNLVKKLGLKTKNQRVDIIK